MTTVQFELMAEHIPTATDGQPLGKRGLQTRRRILDVVSDLLESNGPRGFKLIDVAEGVGFSPPAFYQYFRDLDEAILVLCAEVGAQAPGFVIPDEWMQESADVDRSTLFVRRYFEYTEAHRKVLLRRHLALQDDDPRFEEMRDKAFGSAAEPLMTKIADGQNKGQIDPSLSPLALAGSLLAMVERVAMLAPHIVERWGIEEANLIEAVSYVVGLALGCDADADQQHGDPVLTAP